MKLAAIAAALSIVFSLSACNRGPDQNKSSSAGGTADQSQSQPSNAPKRSTKP